MYSVLSLFSGIAGFEQGIAAAGLQEHFQVVQFVENNEYCQKVLSKRFPTIPIWGDIKTFNPERGEFDCIVGGFPCQPFSVAGKRKGKEDDRYLWDEVVRLLRAVQPQWFIGENVAGLLSIDSGRVFRGILWDLVQCGYSIEWSIVSAASVGAVHRRERVFIIATNAQSTRWLTSRSESAQARADIIPISCGDAITNPRCWGLENSQEAYQRRAKSELGSPKSTHPDSTGLEGRQCKPSRKGTIREFERSHGSNNGQTEVKPCFRRENDGIPRKLDANLMTHQDLPEWLPLATDSDNIPYRKERLMALGNAVVPQVAAIAWKRLAQIAGVA